MIDLHLHTTASDGRLRPSDLVVRAAAAGLTVISVTDHDTTAGLSEASTAADRLGLTLVAGIEITAVEDARDVHVLGYFIDAENAALASFLADQRADRLRRVREMAERLHALGFHVDLERALAHAAESEGRSVGRPLVADALVSAGLLADRREAFDRLLGQDRPAFVPRRGASVADVISIIHSAGGIASLAHPGSTAIDDALDSFVASGLTALEVRHSDHDLPTEQHYRSLAAHYGLAVSGGSDFHGDRTHHGDALGIVTLPESDFEGLRSRVVRASPGRHP